MDSRDCFLAKYRLCFDGLIKTPLYFNPKVDIVMFSDELALQLFLDAVNHLPSAGAREDVAPVRKDAIRWIIDNRPKGYRMAKNIPDNLALDPAAGGVRYRFKLRTLLERLPALKQFAFCYLDRYIEENSRQLMIRFLKGLEKEMNERLQLARENSNKTIAQSAGNCPSILMLHCPENRILAVSRGSGDNAIECKWSTVTMSLPTRDWECSRSLGEWSVEAFGGQ